MPLGSCLGIQGKLAISAGLLPSTDRTQDHLAIFVPIAMGWELSLELFEGHI